MKESHQVDPLGTSGAAFWSVHMRRTRSFEEDDEWSEDERDLIEYWLGHME
jgi:hypothetical protein